MVAEIEVRWASLAGQAHGDLGVRHVNTSGIPVASCDRRDLGSEWNGQLVADVYTLDFLTGPQVTVTADLGTKNPWHNTTPVGITADGSTPHDQIVPGLRLIFDATTGNGDRAIVSVGALLNLYGVDTNAFNFGIRPNDGERVEFRAAAVNVGDMTAATVTIRPLPGLYYDKEGAVWIARLGPHSDGDRAILAPADSVAMTFQNWTNAGSYYTADVRVDGDLCIATAKFDGETVYEYGSANGYVDGADKLKGLQVIFALTTSDPTSETIDVIVTNGWTWASIAPDVAGSAAGFTTGEVLLGDIASGETVFFWVGFTVPEGQARGDVRLWTPRIRYLEV